MASCAHRHLVAGAFKTVRDLIDVRRCCVAWPNGLSRNVQNLHRPPKVWRRCHPTAHDSAAETGNVVTQSLEAIKKNANERCG
jgi:hypothetical protein